MKSDKPWSPPPDDLLKAGKRKRKGQTHKFNHVRIHMEQVDDLEHDEIEIRYPFGTMPEIKGKELIVFWGMTGVEPKFVELMSIKEPYSPNEEEKEKEWEKEKRKF